MKKGLTFWQSELHGNGKNKTAKKLTKIKNVLQLFWKGEYKCKWSF